MSDGADHEKPWLFQNAAVRLRHAVLSLISSKPVTSTKRTANANPTAGDDTDVDCSWCTKRFKARRGGTRQRFCSVHCRMAFWSALRRWGEAALTAGTLIINAIRDADPAACTLPQPAKSPPSSAAADAATARFVVQIPQALIQRLAFRHFAICHYERDDLPVLLAALGRIGQKPTITETAEHVRVLSF
jgi:hypothetical protein